MLKDLFQNVAVDKVSQTNLLKRPAATTSYVIHFTPRSGSSWLTDIISATKKLSAANEAFNPNFIPKIAQAIGAVDMDSYIHLLLRKFNSNGVYGVEVTAHQINAVFEGYAGFHNYFGNSPCFWLIREDIVAQAVSLAKMVTTNVAHTDGSDDATRLASDVRFEYDAALIKKWLEHIHAAEIKSESWFLEYNLFPLRMSYEQTTGLSPLQMVNVISRHLGRPDIAPMTFSTQHTKLGTVQNERFASRFRDEHGEYMAGIDALRSPMLAKLNPIADMVADL